MLLIIENGTIFPQKTQNIRFDKTDIKTPCLHKRKIKKIIPAYPKVLKFRHFYFESFLYLYSSLAEWLKLTLYGQKMFNLFSV